MKTQLLLAFIFLSSLLFGRNDSNPKLEASFQCAQVNIGYRHLYYTNQLELFNTISFRSYSNRMAIRGHFSYSRSLRNYPFYDVEGYIYDSKSWLLSVGAQYRIWENVKWNYFFADLGFKQCRGGGSYSRYQSFPVSIQLKAVSSGGQFRIGSGIRLKAGRYLGVVCETGIATYFMFNNYTYPIEYPQLLLLPEDNIQLATGFFCNAGLAIVLASHKKNPTRSSVDF